MKPFITNAFQAGKYVLPFQIEGIAGERLAAALKGSSIKAYGLPTSHSFQEAWQFRLVLDSGWIVDFSSACTEVGNWKEVGSLILAFKLDLSESDSTPRIMQPVLSFRVQDIERLVYDDADVLAETGIILRDELGREVIVAAGVAPGSVSIAAPFLSGDFKPEFSVEKCQRQPV